MNGVALFPMNFVFSSSVSWREVSVVGHPSIGIRRQSTTDEILIARGFRRESTNEDLMRSVTPSHSPRLTAIW